LCNLHFIKLFRDLKLEFNFKIIINHSKRCKHFFCYDLRFIILPLLRDCLFDHNTSSLRHEIPLKPDCEQNCKINFKFQDSSQLTCAKYKNPCGNPLTMSSDVFTLSFFSFFANSTLSSRKGSRFAVSITEGGNCARTSSGAS
jgi:hypothetical protein